MDRPSPSRLRRPVPTTENERTSTQRGSRHSAAVAAVRLLAQATLSFGVDEHRDVTATDVADVADVNARLLV